MAFESFLNQDKVKPRGRRVMYTVSIAVHAAMVVIGIIYSFWYVEELSPPTVAVTFMSAPAPPPPPPPPPKRKSKPKTQPTEIVQPKPDVVVQPKEEPEPEPEEEEEDEGVEGGVEGGVPGGVVGGVIGSTVAPVESKVLPPNVAAGQEINCVKPVPPPMLVKANMILFNMIKVCVGVDGAVKTVTMIKPSDKLWDDVVTKAAKECKYKPYAISGHPVPFCFVARYNMKIVN